MPQNAQSPPFSLGELFARCERRLALRPNCRDTGENFETGPRTIIVCVSWGAGHLTSRLRGFVKSTYQFKVLGVRSFAIGLGL
jgi:hypothetical protein